MFLNGAEDAKVCLAIFNFFEALSNLSCLPHCFEDRRLDMAYLCVVVSCIHEGPIYSFFDDVVDIISNKGSLCCQKDVSLGRTRSRPEEHWPQFSAI